MDSKDGGHMSGRSMKENDPLEEFALRETTLDGVTKRVYVAGSGPTVIVMSEMPGISPHVARVARWVRDAGFTVYMPSLFGSEDQCSGVQQFLRQPPQRPSYSITMNCCRTELIGYPVLGVALKVSFPVPPSSTAPETQPDHTIHVRPGLPSYPTCPGIARPSPHSNMDSSGREVT
jgi:hypothetical protein